MRIIAPLVCTFLFSLALPSLSFAANCENAGSANGAKNCVKYNNNQNGNGNGNSGKGNCNGNGNCGNNAKEKAKDYDDDHAVECRDINSITLRRQCLERRR